MKIKPVFDKVVLIRKDKPVLLARVELKPQIYGKK